MRITLLPAARATRACWQMSLQGQRDRVTSRSPGSPSSQPPTGSRFTARPTSNWRSGGGLRSPARTARYARPHGAPGSRSGERDRGAAVQPSVFRRSCFFQFQRRRLVAGHIISAARAIRAQRGFHAGAGLRCDAGSRLRPAASSRPSACAQPRRPSACACLEGRWGARALHAFDGGGIAGAAAEITAPGQTSGYRSSRARTS